jgi:DNA-binding MarR family transcriptional regulator
MLNDKCARLANMMESMRPVVGRQTMRFRTQGPMARLTDVEIPILEQIGCQGEVTMSNLAEYFGVTRSTITSHINRLEAKKMVRRVRRGKDRRQVWLHLAGQGAKLHHALLAMHEGILREIARNLSQSELDLLIRIFNKIVRHILEKHSGFWVEHPEGA